MYEKLHILSPLVEAREFFFIRGCRQLDATTWIMVDISYDIFNDIQSDVPSCSWKFPSGCAIQDMGNGQSKVRIISSLYINIYIIGILCELGSLYTRGPYYCGQLYVVLSCICS